MRELLPDTRPIQASVEVEGGIDQRVDALIDLARTALAGHVDEGLLPDRPWAFSCKRGFDLFGAALALTLLSPILLLISMLVRLDGGSALFVQKRVGRHGKIFNCYKFRSMRPGADVILLNYLRQNTLEAFEWRHFQKLKKDMRITKIGRILRRWSLDELPQILNVLRGDMSLVGPRPCTPQQTNLYGDGFAHYTSVRPGITGPWQVNGRNKLTFQQRVELEARYARNWNLWTDAKIIFKTIPVLLKRDEAF